MDYIKLKASAQLKNPSSKWKGTHCMVGPLCQWYIDQGFNLHNIERTHMTQHQEDKQFNLKMGKGPE